MKTVFWYFGTLMTILLALLLTISLAGIRFNLSSSLPGILWQSHPYDPAKPIQAGDTVFICPTDEPVFRLAKARGYLNGFTCPHAYGPLLKPVQAVAGDRVSVRKNGVWINGVRLPRSTPQIRDRTARYIPALPFTDYTLSTNQLWLQSVDNAYSFDSRYFGPLTIQQIQGRATPFHLPEFMKTLTVNNNKETL